MRLLRIFVAPIPTLVFLGCGGGDLVLPPRGQPAEIELIEGDAQIGSPGAPLPEMLVVRLVDAAGDGIPDGAVTWVVSTGGGSVTPVNGTTDGDGYASARWTLGPSAGPNTVTAVVAGVGGLTFTAMGITGGGGPEPSASRSTVSADPASIQAGIGASTITVTVLNGDGDPIAGAVVALQASGSDNTLTQPSTTTGADGIATGTLRSASPGTRVISATVNGSVEVRQTAQVTVTPAPATRIESIEGNNQNAAVGTRVPVRPAVRVTDDLGQPVAGVGVTFVVTGGGGSVDDGQQTTNSAGIARVGDWTLGPLPGTNTLEARADALQGSPVVFTAEGTLGGGGSVDRFFFRVQPHDVDEDEPFSVEVALVDAAGNVVPLSGIVIYIGLFPEGSSSPANNRLLGQRFRQTGNGVAVFSDLRVTHGNTSYRFRALSDDLPALGPVFSQLFTVD